MNDLKARTAIVFIPVKSVTVADPPRISMDDTMMFVARLALLIARRDGRTERQISTEHARK